MGSGIGNFPSLRKLFLNDNKLSTVPPSIGDLLRLEELYLFNNR